MARLFGIVLSDNDRVAYALTQIYGIGWNRSSETLKAVKISETKRVKELTEDELKQIATFIEKNYRVEGNLREQVNEHLKRIRENGSYRGHRHAHGLPSRGQRTRSNARTKRGKRKTVGALKKEAWAKLEQSQAKK